MSNFTLHHIIIIWRTNPFFLSKYKSCLNIVQSRPPVDFDTCVMEQYGDIQNTSLDTSFNNTNQSLHSSRLSNGAGQNNVSFLKRRLFEDEEEEDVNLLPEDDEQSTQTSNIVTSTQRPKSPPQCDSETEVNLIWIKNTKNVICTFRMIIVFPVRLIG